jgi:hypothetical protein
MASFSLVRGKAIEKVAPSPGWLSAQMRPPCNSIVAAISAHVDRAAWAEERAMPLEQAIAYALTADNLDSPRKLVQED